MSKYLSKLDGKRVVVIGGTSGIGYAVAEASIEYGAIVTIASSSQKKVNDTIQRLKNSYQNAQVGGATVDLRSDKVEAELISVFEYATNNGQHKIDHVAFTAGDSLRPVPLNKIRSEDILSSFKVRVVGCMIAAKVSQHYMRASVQSSFTITGGVGDEKPRPGRGTLAPAGGAVKALGNALATELVPIRANVVCAGTVRTEMYDSIPDDKREQTLDMFRKSTLTETIGSPEDLAEVYIAIMKNYFVTGSRHYADGGYLLKKSED